jgi:hypothetical protein
VTTDKTQFVEVSGNIREVIDVARRLALTSVEVSDRAYSITRKPCSSKLASADDLRTLPLHSKPVPTADIDRIRSWMNGETRSRFDELIAHQNRAPGDDMDFRFRLLCPTEHAEQLVKDGVAYFHSGGCSLVVR